MTHTFISVQIVLSIAKRVDKNRRNNSLGKQTTRVWTFEFVDNGEIIFAL
jgi:hypothetical protein